MENSNHQFENYSVIEQILANTPIPRMFPVHQHFNDAHIENLENEVIQQMEAKGVSGMLHPGMKICITDI